jgi:hypothetical protein
VHYNPRMTKEGLLALPTAQEIESFLMARHSTVRDVISHLRAHREMGAFEMKSAQKSVSQVTSLNQSVINKLEKCQEMDNLEAIKKILSDVTEDVMRVDDFAGVKFPNIQGMIRNSSMRMKLTEEKLLMVTRDMQDFLNKFQFERI